MKLTVLGSSSSGNCYFLENEKEILIIECGLGFKEIQKGINFQIDKVVGCLVTHEHIDHSKSIEKLRDSSVDMYASKGTYQALNLVQHHRLHEVKSKQVFQVGSFKILAFETEHDSKEPLGFLIEQEELGKMLFITDSYYCKYNFKGLDHVLVEANYSEEILQNNIENERVNKHVAKRIRKSHFEINDVIKFLKASDLSNTKNIVLLHLSNANSSIEFEEKIQKAVGIPTFTAKKGLEIEVNRN